MNETVLLWLLGGLVTGGVGWMSCLSWNAYQTNLRMTRMETVLLSISKKAAMLLHDTHDKHELDAILDNYALHHDLSDQEWDKLLNKCRDIVEKKNVPPLEQLLAYVALVGHLCLHKKMRHREIKKDFGIQETPPNPT